MIQAQREALRVLAGCPNGATTYELQFNRKITSQTMRALVRSGYARETIDNLRTGMRTERLWITPAGKARLNHD
jgi:hypothetical protein